MKISVIISIAVILSLSLKGQDTFSIVAVDSVTGEIGSAGASCIDETAIQGGAVIISDVLPGRGAIHTQSYWNATNQQNAHDRMVEGMSPLEIIDWLVAHDVSNNPGVRQYGIVDFDTAGHPRTAGFTGANCLNYKNHITGPNYSIQGNILLGQQILDSMEARFLNSEGSLPEKLMAALQGANVVGADTRCMTNGTSSLSAFIRVARTNDTTGSFYCDLNVPSVPEGMEPIDSLQVLFDAWLGTTVRISEPPDESGIEIYPNPAAESITVSRQQVATGGNASKPVIISIYNRYGQVLHKVMFIADGPWKESIDIHELPAGIYFVQVESADISRTIKKLVIN